MHTLLIAVVLIFPKYKSCLDFLVFFDVVLLIRFNWETASYVKIPVFILA